MYRIINDDCLHAIAEMPDNSIDAIVTDPPYGLSSHSQADIVEALTAWLSGKEYTHGGKGFMGKEWDSFVPSPMVFAEMLRVLKPGGHLLCFAGSRTQDLMGIAIRLAGFETRDCLQWIYAQGFPKSLNIGKAIDKEQGNERQVIGSIKKTQSFGHKGNNVYRTDIDRNNEMIFTAPASPESAQWEGFGTALKPAYEMIILARKPLEKGLTVAQNVLKWGVGALNIDGCRIEGEGYVKHQNVEPRRLANDGYGMKSRNAESHPAGRYPANILHDGSDEVEAAFAAFGDKGGGSGGKAVHNSKGTFIGKQHEDFETQNYSDSGSASRFFFSGKASKKDRDEGLPAGETNGHCTVKPTALMRYLCRLIAPPDGLILDPFMGSGSTGKAAILEGFNFTGIELSAEYCDIARARLAHVYSGEGNETTEPTLTPVNYPQPPLTPLTLF